MPQANIQSSGNKIDTMLQSLKKHIRIDGGCPEERIVTLEKMFGLALAQDYRSFLMTYGALVGNQFAIFGLGAGHTGMQLPDLLFLLRLKYTTFPLNLVPVEDLGQGELACIDGSNKASPVSPVYRISLTKNISLSEAQVLAPSFDSYLFERLNRLKRDIGQVETGMVILEQRVKEFQAQYEYDHDKGGKLPRSHIWRPYRFCVQDVVLGTTVVRHVKGDNCLEVDVFLTTSIPQYEPDSGVRGLALFLLCEAYKCGGTMEIRFTGNVEGGRVPAELEALAERLGVPIPLDSITAHRLTPSDSRALFAALTGFSQTALQRIAELDLSIERACYVVNKDIWTRHEVEAIMLSASKPDRLFAGGAAPEQRALFAQDLLQGRAALLAGCLERRLIRVEHTKQDTHIEVEDDERSLSIEFNKSLYANICSCLPSPSETASIFSMPWLVDGTLGSPEIPFSSPFTVLVRARDGTDLSVNLEEDLRVAWNWSQSKKQLTFILIPFDFNDDQLMPPKQRARFLKIATLCKTGLLVCPESVASLDLQVRQRMQASRIVRE